MKPAYLVARTIFPKLSDPSEATGSLAEYLAKAPASIEKYGGEFIVRPGRSEILEGGDRFSPCMVVKFPSYEIAKEWYGSEEYTDLKKMREGHAEVDVLLIEGV